VTRKFISRKDWCIQVCEGGERYLRHARSREAAFAAKKEIEGSKAAGIRHIQVHDLRWAYASLGVSAGAPVSHVSKSLGHSETATTDRLYANLTPGAARELPNVIEQYVRNEGVRNANGMRTE